MPQQSAQGRGRGVWQPRPSPDTARAVDFDSVTGRPQAAIGQRDGERQCDDKPYNQQMSSMQLAGRALGASQDGSLQQSTSLQPDGMTWQQRSMMQPSTSQQQQQEPPRQGRRQRQPQKLQRHTDGELGPADVPAEPSSNVASGMPHMQDSASLHLQQQQQQQPSQAHLVLGKVQQRRRQPRERPQPHLQEPQPGQQLSRQQQQEELQVEELQPPRPVRGGGRQPRGAAAREQGARKHQGQQHQRPRPPIARKPRQERAGEAVQLASSGEAERATPAQSLEGTDSQHAQQRLERRSQRSTLQQEQQQRGLESAGRRGRPVQPASGVSDGEAASSGREDVAQQGQQAQGQTGDGGAAEGPQCLVCCSPMTEVSVGVCNHKSVCGTCSLRLRLCYGRVDCPLCKAELKEVVIAPWRGEGPPDFDFYQSHPESVARSTKWARGIAADRWVRGGRMSSRLLHELQRRTALACVLCDRNAARPFPRKELLARHVLEAHGRRLCNLCLEEGHLFALEMQTYPSQEVLQGHLAEAHARCDFCCRRFYDDDGLWKHMQQAHYSCHVCPPPSGTFAYFNTARDLEQHMRSEHHMCEEPECADCFVAFTTVEELRRHHLERHSARMPRWDSSRARPLQIDIQFVHGPQGPARQRGRAERRSQAQPSAAAAPQDVRLFDQQGGGSGGRAGSGSEERGGYSTRPEYARETDGGFLILDDDLGLVAPRDEGPPGGGNFPHFEPVAGGSWARGSRPRGPTGGGEEFPSLATAAAVAGTERGDAGVSNGGGGGGGAGRRPPPLVKKTIKCPCGRRVSHYVVEEGQEVPPLPCDAVCELEGRRSQLAGAFGVDHPERHVSYFERHRTPTYSGELLAAAQKHPKAIEGLEKAFAAFLDDASSRRHSLAPMPREMRGAAHELAQQYGLATQSYGQEPGRYVELFKTDSAGVPSKLLSRVAPTVSPQEVAAMVKEGTGHPMRLTDVAMSVDVNFYLRRWEGAYKLEWEGGDTVVVRFDNKEDLDEALSALGGGIRGLFRVDRTYRPRAALTATTGVSSSSHAGGWSAVPSSSDAAGDASWTTVAASAPRQVQLAQEEGSTSSKGASGGGRWMIIGKKKVQPQMPAGVGPPFEGGQGPAGGAGAVQASSAAASTTDSYLGLADDAWEA